MSLIGINSVYPYSLTGIQDITGTVNGSTPIVSISIAGQTFYLAVSPPDSNGNVVLTLNIATASTSTTGLLTDGDWNVFNGKENVLTFSSPLTRLGNTISFDFSIPNTFTGVITFSNVVNFNSNIQCNALPLAITSNILYIDGTGLVSYGASPVDLLPLNNIWTGSTNRFQNAVIVENENNSTYSLLVYRSQLLFPDFTYINNAGKMGYYDGVDKWTIDRFGQFVGGSIIVNDFIQATNNITTTAGYLGGNGLYINGLDVFLYAIPSSSDPHTLNYNTTTKQVSYALSLTEQLNNWNEINYFRNDVCVGAGPGPAGRLTVNNGDGILSDVGCFTVCYENYAPSWNVGAWTDRFILFSHGNGVGKIQANAPALAFCQLSATENYIISNRPGINWMNTTIAGDSTSIKYQGSSFNTVTFSVFQTTWYEPTGAIMSYLIRNGVTNLKWVVFFNPSQYCYYDTTANVLGTTSDERTKKNIRPIDIEKSKQFILSITPSIFQYKEGDYNNVDNIGFIAQDVLKCAKTEAQRNIVCNWKKYEEAIARGEEPKDILGVSATLIIPELVGTIQHLNKEIEQLKQENDILKQENDILKQNQKLILERLTAIEEKLLRNRNILKY